MRNLKEQEYPRLAQSLGTGFARELAITGLAVTGEMANHSKHQGLARINKVIVQVLAILHPLILFQFPW